MTDFTHILNLTVHIYCNLKNVKKEKGNTVCHLVAKSICVKESAFLADFTLKLYLNKLTRCLLKKCKENLLYFQERLLTTSPG